MNENQGKLLLILQIFTLILVIILLVDRLTVDKTQRTQKAVKVIENSIPANDNVIVNASKDFVLGETNSKNFLIVYSNYTCNHCMYFHRVVVDSLSPYIEKGELKIVFKDFISSNDKTGLFASKIANIAYENDLFNQMHEFMINNAQNNDSLILTNKLIDLGLSSKSIIQGLNNVSILNEIKEDTESGKKLNISGTPSYVLNGQTYIGFLSYKDIVSNLKK